jgi:hypothetical protein
MTDGKGILSAAEEKQFAEFLDGLIDFTKFKGVAWKFVEMFDGKLFQVAVEYLDDNLGEKIPAHFKEDTNALVKAVIEKDVDKVQLYSARILNTLIDVPYLTEDAEAILIGAVMEGLVKVIQDWAKKNAEKYPVNKARGNHKKYDQL